MAYLVASVGGRLTLTSGVPVTEADVTGASGIILTPYLTDCSATYSPTTGTFEPVQFGEMALALNASAQAMKLNEKE